MTHLLLSNGLFSLKIVILSNDVIWRVESFSTNKHNSIQDLDHKHLRIICLDAYMVSSYAYLIIVVVVACCYRRCQGFIFMIVNKKEKKVYMWYMVESYMEIMMSHKLIEKIATLVLHINKEVVRGYMSVWQKQSCWNLYCFEKTHK